MKDIKEAINKIFTSLPYGFLAITIALLALMIYYATLVSATPWDIFVGSNKAIYVLLQIALSIINAALIGLVIAMFVYVLEKRKKDSNLTFVQALASLLFSVAATGCTVCGAVLLPTLGIAGSLTALPFAGLEIKLLTIILLSYSLYEYSRIMAGKCEINTDTAFNVKKHKDGVDIGINNSALRYLKPIGVTIVFFMILLLLPSLTDTFKVDFSKDTTVRAIAETDKTSVSQDDFTDQINPSGGYDLGVKYGDLGPQIIKTGALDQDKFIEVYEQSGNPLSDSEIRALTEGSDENIVINRENSYFLLNFFWALGLANENPILTEGDIAQYGDGKIGSFASTGGWTIATKDLEDYYSATSIIDLTDEQQALVEEVSSNIYRPCCGNSTAFPDCNHGMALLGALQLMAANGATEDDMYEASKYINAYWFPSTYNDLAMYFKATQDQDFEDIDGKTILSKEFSSSGGYQSKKAAMQQQGLLPEPPKTSGGGCGV